MDKAQVIQALELVRHELTVMHGLMAFDGAAPQVAWPIDTTKAVALIDGALSDSSSLGQTHSSSAESPESQNYSPETCRQCGGTCPSMRPQTVAEKILTVHQAIQRNMQLGLPAPTWSDLDLLVAELVPS